MTPPADDVPPTTVSVFIADDNDTKALWTVRLGEVPARDGRRFQIVSDVSPTADLARSRLRRGLSLGVLPEVVVIDHDLTGFSGDLRESGLGLMRWLADACRARGLDLPRCVLWSDDYEEGLVDAFIDAGGTHAFPRKLPTFVSALWSVVDGARWTAAEPPHRLELEPAQVALLPYLEANLSTVEIARRLQHAGVIRPTVKNAQAWVNDNRSKLVRACNELIDARNAGRRAPQAPVERFGKGQSVAITAFARAHGHRWIPLRFRDPDVQDPAG